jgi:hypothetical protein
VIEEWRPVVGYEGVYEVSNCGRVKRVKPTNGAVVGRVLKPQPSHGGYVSVHLLLSKVRTCLSIHRLVAAAWLGPCPEGWQVNHIDHDPTNNRIENLQYVTPKDNIQHARKAGRLSRGEHRHNARLTADQVLEIRASTGVSQRELAEKYSVQAMTINLILRRRTWAHL